jgi:AraC family transcriptional regulator
MQPRIENLAEKKLIGLNLRMSLLNNRTGALWQSFMPRRHEIKNTVSSNLISLQIYSPSHFKNFSPANEFTKWAAVEVRHFEDVPSGFDTMIIPSGTYAVFHYKGSSTDSSIFQYIFSEWLPKSRYALDDRPHFELLGEKYKNADPSSEEEIWIPVTAG